MTSSCYAEVGRICCRATLATVALLTWASPTLRADKPEPPRPTPKVPVGFSIELAAASPLVERPIVAAFDDEGRLYVAESSGSNDPVQKQLEEKPHRVVRLEDADGDGKFDRRTVFADKLMFPQGALFFDGSLYVSAAPSIWKLTDRDGDGIADERVEWFQGKTLTGCANDLHGPYAGPDGWIYWCKGAFAEQTHTVDGRELKTKAAHVFRCRPDGSGFEPVITAGMDNPVDVAFTADGDCILSGTYFVTNPRRDGLAHAVYGGVYGKENGVLEGHVRTGDLMPVFDPMPPTAACGLERYDSDIFGPEYRDNFFLCQFNMRSVSRHILKPAGSTFTSEDSDFVSSDDVDFHPTDVVVDADGSLLVVDTGGWYKLCCPTSQLWKPDVLGGIYRVRKIGAKPPDDPRGRRIGWADQSLEQLWALHIDGRHAVRLRASREFVRRRNSPGIGEFFGKLQPEDSLAAKDGTISSAEIGALAHVWTLAQFDEPEARQLLTSYFSTDSERARHAILQAVSVSRDQHTLYPNLLRYALKDSSPANRRLVVEVLGRLREWWAVPEILAAADRADDRVFQHSVIYALIELADPEGTRLGLVAKSPKTIAAALIALDQMPSVKLQPREVIQQLNATDETLNHAARWVVMQHADWGGELSDWLRNELKSASRDDKNASAEKLENLEAILLALSSQASIQNVVAEAATSHDAGPAGQALALRMMAKARLPKPPRSWVQAQVKVIGEADAELLPLAIAAARVLPPKVASNGELKQALAEIASSTKYPAALRVDALAVVAGQLDVVTDAHFKLLEQSLSNESPVPVRAAAVDAIDAAHLNEEQLSHLCDVVRSAGPLEMNRLYKPFERSQADDLGLQLIKGLRESPNVSAVRLDLLRQSLAKYGPKVQSSIGELESLVNVDAAAQRKRIEELLPLVEKGDVRRGHAVYYSSKATCAACHRLGHAGGTTGPDLTHVGKTRAERDILESILFPNLSFVRSYEPMQVVTQDGTTINGVIREENAHDYVFATGPDQTIRVPREEIDEMQPSKVSIMPAGLDKQLTPQELADLVAFLKSTTGK